MSRNVAELQIFLQYITLWHVEPLLGNGSANGHKHNNSTTTGYNNNGKAFSLRGPCLLLRAATIEELLREVFYTVRDEDT
jgi:hypothetical protein